MSKGNGPEIDDTEKVSCMLLFKARMECGSMLILLNFNSGNMAVYDTIVFLQCHRNHNIKYLGNHRCLI